LTVKVYAADFKLRSIDPGYEVLQVFVGAFEKKTPENRENSTHRRWTSAILIRASLIESESKGEMLKPGQRGKASDHYFR
jgi:hypothetical protein